MLIKFIIHVHGGWSVNRGLWSFIAQAMRFVFCRSIGEIACREMEDVTDTEG